MRFKTFLLLATITVFGIIASSFFIGNVLMNQVVAPFGTIQTAPQNPTEPITVDLTETAKQVKFVDADLFTGWIPWVIKQISILIGGLALIVFFYAGVDLIINGDNEEQLSKDSKMIIFGVVGIALAALSYTIVANILIIF